MCQVDPCTIPDCNIDTWTLEWLKLEKGTKLNFTNRFPFQSPYDPGDDDDVFYVKKLILREDAVLNTSYNRVYYESLEREPNAVIKDVPILGFSLSMIALNDDTEFIQRVTHNNFRHPQDPNHDRDHVTRFEGNEPDPNGMMQMRNIAVVDPNSPECGQMVGAQAKGMFANASEDQILITLEYMFIEDPLDDAELIVYLSDDSELGESDVEVARIRPPTLGRRGSIGSGSFADFTGVFPRGGLDFIRGTYVGLELRGTDAVCWIDNWDPQVNCIGICGDFHVDMFDMVNVYDYLVLVAEFGLTNPASVGKGCLDLVTDACINAADLAAWGIDEVLSRCPVESSALAEGRAATTSGPTLPPVRGQEAGGSGPVLLLGKPVSGAGVEIPESYSYRVDSNGSCTVDSNAVGSDGRFVSDSYGRIYQVNGHLGLVRQDTGTVVAGPDVVSYGDSLVSVGFIDGEGLLLADAAFKACDPNIVYVVPVQVDPQDGNCPYQAAAKLELTGAGHHNLLQIYGKNPATDPCQKTIMTECEGDPRCGYG
jgi:hypothetical protein